MNLNLKKVTYKNYEEVKSVHVAKGQEGFIETTEQCLNEAKNLDIWRPVGIYDDKKLIGFAMYGFFKNEGENGRVWLDRFMIGSDHQGKGYGKTSLILLINQLKKEYNCDEIFLSIYESNIIATKLYKEIGFKFNGEFDINKEKVMVLNLK
ncbi:GNAT family N-acetyltransferase [Clostridium botulinum]|nr:GNAT family N-acetyltransferase [Clostridium botulinum]NFN19638.1 GNAT family N-acetyltransferase [Clostridium botulinum]NFN49609.1 GNAT family N-acetyltransferase [Clostridium botulinum]NFP00790.1 GNAT family N-acetyltransferase [Clostridium botulinum]NFT93802.1 GNAT family N-acetyltransferase [Clostridium botulinum]